MCTIHRRQGILTVLSADDGAPGDSVGGSSLGESRRHVRHRCAVGAMGGRGESVYFFFQLFFSFVDSVTQKDKEKKCPVCGAGVGSHMWTSSRLPQ